MSTDTPPSPLAGIRVVDLTTEVAGPYCTKLFADAGAEVVVVEPADGDPLRGYAATGPVPPGDDGALLRYLRLAKKVAGPETRDRLDELLAGADLVVVDTDEPWAEALRDRHPHLVVASITAFGRTGPCRGRPAVDLTLQAESGALMFRGDPARAPVVAGGRVGEFLGGLFTAPVALAAVLRARATGQGAFVDVSVHDVLAIAGSNSMWLLHEILGRPELVAPMRSLETPGIETASDGLVAFNTNAGPMLQMFLLMVGRPDLMDDPAYAGLAGRLAMGEAWQRIIDDWTTTRTVAEIIDAAVALRVPVAPVHDGASVLHDEHLVARGVFRTSGDGLVHPRPPYRIDGHTIGTAAPARRVGADDLEAWSRPDPSPATGAPPGLRGRQATSDDGFRPLAGLKVLDLTSWWVGGLATQTLALLGAEVVHVEGVAHPDGMRLTGARLARSEDWWEWGHMFAATNTDKLGLAVDLATDDGRDILHRLVDWADVLVENFSPRVAESWGLTREAVLARNPRLVYQRMPAYGLDGPWRDRPAFAQTIEPMSTMASITGYPDAKPLSKGGIPDPVAGMHGAWAALVGLAERQRRDGRGVFVEAVMVEAALAVCAQPALEAAAYRRVMGRTGNRCDRYAPQGVYRARGDDQWLALAATTDAQWQALARLVAGEVLADDDRFSSVAGRLAGHDELDALLAAWTAPRDAYEAADLLATAGVPAAACRDPRGVDRHPQYAARGLFAEVDHPVLGRHHAPGLPCLVDGAALVARRAAPTFGRDNDEVLTRLCGLDANAVARLRAAGVVADRPRGL